VTRKKQVVWTVAAATLGLAAVTALWLSRDADAPADESEAPTHATRSTEHPADVPTDPQALAEIRQAYQSSLAQNAPPGMLELMDGSRAGKADELPPLPDPFLTPARYSPPGSAVELPPLPPDLAARPELLPPPDESPVVGQRPKADPLSGLPPLPPLK
jgi:hypothetical protein